MCRFPLIAILSLSPLFLPTPAQGLQSSSCTTGDGTFGTVVSWFSGSGPYAVEVGDLDLDGIPDLVVANQQGNSISVLFGIGDGSFAPPVSYGVGSRPQALALVDLNSDGMLDVLVSNAVSDDVSVLLGAGAGALALLGTVAIGGEPKSLITGDFNEDGHEDFLVRNLYFAGNGDGTFAAPSVYVSGTPTSLGLWAGKARDIDGDSHLDIVTILSNGVRLIRGTGQGSFSPPEWIVTGGRSEPADLELEDLDNDGHLDIVATKKSDDMIAVHLGAGDGTFAAPTTYTASIWEPVSLVCEDLDGDGNSDVVVSSEGTNVLAVYLGDGAGGLVHSPHVIVGQGSRGLVSADFNRDGAMDLAVANWFSPGGFYDEVLVALGNTTGDAYEPNDDCASRIPLPIGTTTDLDVWGSSFPSGANEDFWSYSLAPNEIVTVDLQFSHAAGDIDLQLLDDAACSNVVATSDSMSDNELLVYSNATTSVLDLTLRVYAVGPEFICNRYDMVVGSSFDPCLTVYEDGFAPNQNCGTAAFVTPGLYNSLATYEDQDGDFFAIDVLDGYTLLATVNHTATTANLDCYLYDAGVASTCGDSSSDLARGDSDSDEETVSWINSSGSTQTYILQVRHRGGAQPWACGLYNLDISVQPTEIATSICAGDGSLIPCPCTNESSDPDSGCKNATGVGAKLGATGSNSFAGDDLVLHISQARVGQPAMLIQGWTQTAVPFKDGVLCMGNPTKRLEVVSLDISGAGSTTESIVTEGTIPGPGVTRFYQFWYRDPAISPCGTGSNFTNGLEITWE